MPPTDITLDEARSPVVETISDCLGRGDPEAPSGNVGVRIDAERVAISPSGIPYHEIGPGDVPIVDLDDEVLEGELPPSSEPPMPTTVYRHRVDVGGIVHVHSPYATTFASLRRGIDPVHYLIAFAGKGVPVAPYARNGTAAIGRMAAETMGDRTVVLLRSNGGVATGPALDDTPTVGSRVEYRTRIEWQASLLGEPELIDDELDAFIDYFREYREAPWAVGRIRPTRPARLAPPRATAAPEPRCSPRRRRRTAPGR